MSVRDKHGVSVCQVPCAVTSVRVCHTNWEMTSSTISGRTAQTRALTTHWMMLNSWSYLDHADWHNTRSNVAEEGCVWVTHRLSALTGHTIKPSGGVTRWMDGEVDELSVCVSLDAVFIPDVPYARGHTACVGTANSSRVCFFIFLRWMIFLRYVSFALNSH